MVLRVGEDPTSFAPRLRELVADVDPDLILEEVRPLDDSAWAAELAFTAWFWVVLGMGSVRMLLATAGIYSIMSFTVSRRTREIGLRVALGADRRRIVWAMFKRALKQIASGVLVGAVLIVIFLLNPEVGYKPPPAHLVIFAGYLSVMVLVCSLACIVPTRRALAVEPTEALRVDG
jgi:ABC-type antimicrobial peptide transport system permease subunit